jgi:hypothetical protein
MRKLLSLAFIASSSLLAQTQPSSNPLKVVMPTHPGAASAALDQDWKPGVAFLYDEGTRPVLQFSASRGRTLSIILFPNLSGKPTAESCREDVIKPLLRNFSPWNVQRGELTSTAGDHLATVSYVVDAVPGQAIAEATGIHLLQQNAFSFYGDSGLCAELHVSVLSEKSIPTASLDPILQQLIVLPTYQPTPQDYGKMASLLYSAAKDYSSAAIYYERTLATLPENLATTRPNTFRYLTDQLSMSYGISGDLAKSRAINQAAILKDPGYPLYYYNLACADAESGDAAAARTHLQQAYDRRANTLPGEHLPDPTTDDSILKLKHDKSFWTFVQSLPKP